MAMPMFDPAIHWRTFDNLDWLIAFVLTVPVVVVIAWLLGKLDELSSDKAELVLALVAERARHLPTTLRPAAEQASMLFKVDSVGCDMPSAAKTVAIKAEGAGNYETAVTSQPVDLLARHVEANLSKRHWTGVARLKVGGSAFFSANHTMSAFRAADDAKRRKGWEFNFDYDNTSPQIMLRITRTK